MQGLFLTLRGDLLQSGKGWAALNDWVGGQEIYVAGTAYFLGFAVITAWVLKDEIAEIMVMGLHAGYWAIIVASFSTTGTLTFGIGMYLWAFICCFGMCISSILDVVVNNGAEAAI